ncbi:MAG: hypothetical protein SWH78_17415 [Thermodesulfobacteriota bacterium]|nr:hypothetical protein [Thermodesulfobacteriota bacterium]
MQVNEQQLTQLMNESVKLESNVADLYMIFHEAFPEDCAFWYQLHMEEKNHASIIQSAREAWLSGKEFPLEILSPNLDELIALNTKLGSLLEEYRKNPPSREMAFNVALDLEESAGEAHFQDAMEQTPSSELMELFQMLTGEDKEHADRIRTYMRDNGIEIRSKLVK